MARETLATFTYTDAQGVPVYVVERRPGKQFVQRRADGTPSLEGVERVPYRLPQLLAAAAQGGLAFVVEGEKDVERLYAELSDQPASFGDVAATTNAQGAAFRWPDEWVEHFRGLSTVYVLCDNDEPGWKAGQARAELVARVVPDVRLVPALPGVGRGGDVSDYLDGGATFTDLMVMCAEARSVVPRIAPALPASANGNGINRRPPGWPRLDETALHGLAGDIVRTLAPHTEADPVALLVDLLVSFGNAAGGGPHTLVGGAVHPARLNVCIVGRTSRARKGQSRAEVRAIFDECDPHWSEQRVMGGLGSGEGLIAAVRDADNEDRMGVTDKRLMVFEPEFARVLKVGGRDGSTLSAIIREAWDTGRLRVMTRRDPLVASGAHISVLGHVTVEELVRQLGEVEIANGFANRFLFVLVDRARLLPTGGTLDNLTHEALANRMRLRLSEARRIGRMRRTLEAEHLWDSLYRTIADHDAGGIYGSITARAEAQLLRLSLVYALLDGASLVDVPHLMAAWSVVMYADESAAFVWGSELGDPIADRLLAVLRELPRGQGLDGSQQRDLFGRHANGDRLNHARERLQSLGLAETVTEPSTGGRPRIVTFATSDESDVSDRSRVMSLRSLWSQRQRDEAARGSREVV